MLTRQLVLSVLVIFYLPISLVFADNPIIQDDPSAVVSVAVERDDALRTSINLEVTDLQIEAVELRGETYQRATLGLEPTTTREGWPDLPVVSRAVLVSPTGGVNLEIGRIESRIEREFRPLMVPRLDGSVDVDVPGEPAEEFLTYNGFWPPEPVVVSEPAILRGHRIVQVTTYPVQYNPTTGETRFNDLIQFDLVYGGEGVNEVRDPRPKPSIYVNRVLQTLVVNPPEPSRDDLLSGSYLYIVPEVDGVDEALAPLLEWRNRQGHKVVVEHVNRNADAGTIRNIIREAYDWDNPVEFVALVGDAGGGNINVASASGIADYNYSRIDNDPLPDVAVGRISVGSLNDLRRVVNKLVSYEADPPLGNRDWFLQGAVVAGYVNNGLSTVLVAKYVRKELIDLGFTEVRHWYHNENGNIGGNQPFITDCFRWGISIFHYRAYQRMNQLDQSVLNNLPNTQGPWPPVLAISCNTGDFVGQDGHTEAFFRSAGGGVGAIGTATAGTNVKFNNMMSGGVWKGIYKDRLYAFGWGLNMGKYELWKAYNNFDNGYSSFMEWNNLIGDPGTHIWTGAPIEMDIRHENNFTLGASRFTVSVDNTEEESPIADAQVCLYQPGNLHLVVRTDDNGVAEFILPVDALEAGELMVTVTKHNHLPYLAEIDVEEKEFYLGAESWEIEDDEDGIANPGESLEIAVILTNFGSGVPAGAITVGLESLSEWATVTSEPVGFNAAPRVGESAVVPATIAIDPSAPDGETVLLAVNSTNGDITWSSLAALEIVSPKIAVTDIHFDADFNPGDVADMDIQMTNIGHKRIQPFTATIWCESDLLRMLRAESAYNELDPDEDGWQQELRFRLSAHVFTIPGMEVEIKVAIEAENGFRDTTSARIPVGEVANNTPFGPDKYGYVCFDSGDRSWEMAPVYDWVEIDPSEDGFNFEGVNTGLRDGGDNQDRSTVVELPFNFQYYGENFDELTICTNGWAAFGNQQELADFRNRHIAQALGPNAQLCVFWDNLMLDNQSKILTFYDDEEDRFIVEWSKMHRLMNGGGAGEEETFQLILYDIRRFPTYSGDGVIIFQYKDVENGANPARNDTPYCTIGISNLDDSDGLEYTYWNRFHPGALPFANGRNREIAIKFTTATAFVTGILSGQVTDAFNGSGIEGAEVSTTRGFWDITDENGNYEILDILIGDDYEVTAHTQGYNDSTLTDIIIAEDSTTVLNFDLLHPEFNIDVERFDFDMQPGVELHAGIHLANDGNGTLGYTSRYVYLIDEGTEVERGLRQTVNPANRDEPDEAWEELLGWSVTDSTGDSRVNSLVYIHEAEQWIVAGSNNSLNTENYFYRFDRWGHYIDHALQPFEGYGTYDMDYHDGLIYATANQNAIFVLDPETFEVIRSWPSPGRLVSVRALTIDPVTGDFYAASIANLIYKLSMVDDTTLAVDMSYDPRDPRDGERIRRYGLAWFRDDPDGYNLYMISNQVFEDDPEKPDISIYKMDPETGDVIYLTGLENLDPLCGGRGGMCITPKWNNLVWVIATILDNPDGDRVGIFELAPNSSWIDYQPREATLVSGEEVDIAVDIETDGLEDGHYGVTIQFNHNAFDGRTLIPITLDVGDYGICDAAELPLEWSLDQNYPNPFNPGTNIGFTIRESGWVRLHVYDLLGREVEDLVDARLSAGAYRVAFNAEALAAGVYFYKLETTHYSAVRKMVLMK